MSSVFCSVSLKQLRRGRRRCRDRLRTVGKRSKDRDEGSQNRSDTVHVDTHLGLQLPSPSSADTGQGADMKGIEHTAGVKSPSV